MASHHQEAGLAAPIDHVAVSMAGLTGPAHGNNGSPELLHGGEELFPRPAPSSPPIYDLGQCFSTWNVDPHLYEGILELDTSSLNSWLCAEPGPEPTSTVDAKLATLQQIQRLWHSHVPDTPSDDLYYPANAIEPIYGPVTPPRSDSNTIDDQYHQGLRDSLRISLYEPAVPSVDFLNVCVRLYFTKVHPLFPILHVPTFRPCRSNADLLLSICALGCLFTGSDQGLRHGVQLFEHVQKTVLLKWERLSSGNRDAMVSILQSTLISQLFGMLTGSQILLLTVDTFHGPPIAWARYLRLYQARQPVPVDLNVEDHQLDSMWHKWAHNEELLRIAHGLYIIDAELSSILHREPLQRFESYNFSFTASEAAFMAPNAREWKLRLLSEMQHGDNAPTTLTSLRDTVPNCVSVDMVPVNSSFTANAILEGIGMQVRSERARASLDLPRLQEILKSLALFHQRFLSSRTSSHPGSLQLPILWHTIHMMVFADFNFLETVVGREGRHTSQAEDEALREWTESEESRICTKHALMIQSQVESFKATSEPAMHVPRALFWAGIVLCCHIRSGSYEKAGFQTRKTALDIPVPAVGGSYELELSKLDKTAIDSSSLKMALFALTDMLRTLGHWKLSRRFADILTMLTDL